ncbi:hypothetical protein [Streptomyces sp. TLI_146]|uniref:hypothetical protein n=1 Tax=Streptomyces sp. TLI_146 TaxID=1938858 RepID=UPI000C7109EE|nr:hypothetical protein [Streptomyces sp. TLI_146]PKV89909.1 hypothetical protein BX283_7556 [Streptomyces sp. TLI_146]
MNDSTHDRLSWELTGWGIDDRPAHVTELSREEIVRIRDLFDRRLPPAVEDEWLACAAYEVTHDLQHHVLAAVPDWSSSQGWTTPSKGPSVPTSPPDDSSLLPTSHSSR